MGILVEFGDVNGMGDSLFKTGVLGKNVGGGRAVHGISNDGLGVVGESAMSADPEVNIGVQGVGSTGVEGRDGFSVGRLATSSANIGGRHVGVFGEGGVAGVAGFSSLSSGVGVLGVAGEATSVAIQGEAAQNGLAGNFVGDVAVSGSIQVKGDVLLTNRDIAEVLPVPRDAGCARGMVVVMDDDAVLRPCHTDYDKRVVGVVAGAHTLKPAIRLGYVEGHDDGAVVMVGTTYCLVDADADSIAVGDLLTSAARLGYARKAADPARSFGAVIGKALAPLERGQGAIPIIVALQ
jgi:hypothetical protein